jgi:2-polyprenyl-3-methyl-5-hydroxy-6-metoxy-1,4-benzoquinol methylase
LEKNQKLSVQELGLECAIVLAEYLAKTDDLHYGYWDSDVPLELANLKQAQEAHSNFLISHIPPGVKTILDVGSGVGALASRLKAAGYEVDCVSPSPFLNERARRRLGSDTPIFESRFEEFQTEKRYDMVLFSESFQYMKLDIALKHTCELLQPDGYLLICDFFKNPMPDRGPMGGGHYLAKFHDSISCQPLTLVTDIDITAQTAPNLDLTQGFVTAVVQPMKERACELARQRQPFLYKMIRWTLSKPIEQVNKKYFTGQRTGANFAIYKTYRLMLFSKDKTCITAGFLQPSGL